jgi:hypothetical protein
MHKRLTKWEKIKIENREKNGKEEKEWMNGGNNKEMRKIVYLL